MTSGKKKEQQMTRKVYYGYYNNNDSGPHPVIRLGGKYLEDYGFRVGECINIKMELNQITIKKINTRL
jgi:hypothetical protein